ncbi:FtsX-like permease family protein [uncultured Cutibacterium sp.]|uniref:FtsX-like permease family protein n=1 Tax=uncultured Cutibacterium sp. TaxID=1912223 RepID=UPI0028057C56|nr:FtsX-like permease family protein [uncultured Cutibacterium sp.]MDU1581522.1 FtsX-like permease family protein [Cutibacterium granulosum]
MTQHRYRSMVIVMLIALPVIFVTAMGTALEAQYLTPNDQIRDILGDADFIVERIDNWDGHCRQDGLSRRSCGDSAVDSTPGELETEQSKALEKLTLADHELHRMRTARQPLRWGKTWVNVQVYGIDLTSMLNRRLVIPNTPMPAAGEMWASANTAKQFDWQVGTTVSMDGRQYLLTGLVRSSKTWEPEVWVRPESSLVVSDTFPTYFVRGPQLTAAQVDHLNDMGLAVVSRTALSGDYSIGVRTQLLAQILTGGALVALISATVAASAFVICAQRQRQTLSILGTTGAVERQLVGIVLQQGLVLGLTGSILGAVLGCGGANFVIWLQDLNSLDYPVPMSFRWRYALCAIVMGMVASLMASWLPARQVASTNPLRGVRDVLRPPRRLGDRWVILVLSVLAFAVMIVVPRSTSAGHSATQLADSEVLLPVLLSVMLLYPAVLMTIPWVLHWSVGKFPRRRVYATLALRDMDRHRERASACVAASMAVMTLFSSVLCIGGFVDQVDVDHYTPKLPSNVAVLESTLAPGRPVPEAVRTQQVAVVQATVGPVDHVAEELIRQPGCRRRSGCDILTAQVSSAGALPASEESHTGLLEVTGSQIPIVVDDDGSLYTIITGHEPDAAVLDALHRGPVVLNHDQLEDGKLTVGMFSEAATQLSQVQQVDAFRAPSHTEATQVPVLIGRDAAARLLGVADQDVQTSEGDMWARVPQGVSAHDRRTINRSLMAASGPTSTLVLDSGPSRMGRTIVNRGTGIAIVMLMAIGMLTTVLTLTDSRPQRETLSSIGASRESMRRMTAIQTLISTLVGHVSGAVVGAVPPLIALSLLRRHATVTWVPWGQLAGLVFGVPIVLGGMVHLMVRSVPEWRRRVM